MGAWTISGTVASIAGLGVSLWVLKVARGARAAAKEARDQAGKRTLVDELRNASTKIQHISTLFESGEWTAAGMMSQEILAGCEAALTRWPDNLSKERKDGIVRGMTQMRSIVRELASRPEDGVSPEDMKRLSRAQLLAAGHINKALGEAQLSEERSSN